MKWSTLSSEKVILPKAKWKSFAIVIQIYCLVQTLSMSAGEPHIDGEPGDLRFRIKVLKYESDLFLPTLHFPVVD